MSKIHWGSLILGVVIAITVAWALGRRRARVG